MSKKLLKVLSECHSDDYVAECKFSAVQWLQKATTKEIIALALCGWGGDYPADEVAMYMAKWNEEIAFMFKYIEHKNKGTSDHIGFECHVPEKKAMEWLEKNRPAVYKKVKKALEE